MGYMNSYNLRIPDSFRSKILRVFRNAGEAWLESLPGLLDEFISRWQLEECLTEENLSFHYICYAHSPKYGEVVLKTGVPHLELFSGIDALIRYGGNHACKLYEMDREQGIMLMERIIPGKRLKDEADFTKRIKVGAELVKELPLKIQGQNDFPVFEMQMYKAFERARREALPDAAFTSMLSHAENLYGELKSINRPKVLLHGDLHHENILRDEKGIWKVIDPQGRVGEQCLEAGRFLRNEWDWFGGLGNPEHMEKCIKYFAETLNESQRTITICCFLDCAVSVCWSLEDGAGLEAAEHGIGIMNSLMELLK